MNSQHPAIDRCRFEPLKYRSVEQKPRRQVILGGRYFLDPQRRHDSPAEAALAPLFSPLYINVIR